MNNLHPDIKGRTTRVQMRNALGSRAGGFEFWQGPSLFRDAPIVAIVTGAVAKGSQNNTKLGDCAQLWILRSDETPIEALRAGSDWAICGGCVHRYASPDRGPRTCYVDIRHAQTIWGTWQDGGYADSVTAIDWSAAMDLMETRVIRLGSYGDPAALPYDVVLDLTARAGGHIGYTHLWAHPNVIPAKWAGLVMASVESVQERRTAKALGYRTFRIRQSPDDPLEPGEVACPADKSAFPATTVTCEQCQACNGTSVGDDIAIVAHGNARGSLQAKLQRKAAQPALVQIGRKD